MFSLFGWSGMGIGCPGWSSHPWKCLDRMLGDVVWGYSGSAGYTVGLETKASQNILSYKGAIRNIESNSRQCTERFRTPTMDLSS